MDGMSQKLEQVQAEVNKVIKGKEDVVKKVLAAVIAGGHILMEDIPGVGKTTLATTFAKSMSMFLADEINRTSPKTQSALLEVMEEKTATVDGVTRPLPDPFVVIATENPYGSSGTQMLPESQLDRFMVCLSMGYPSHADAVAILKGNAGKPLSKVQEVISMEEVLALRAMTNDLYVKDEIYEYIVNLVEATRTMEIFSMGASPRGTIALLRMAKAMAVIDGRDYVCAKDVQDVARDVLGHRVKLSARGKAQGITMQQAIGMVIANVTAPRV